MSPIFQKLKKSVLSPFTTWMYGCCWCWKMQSSVLRAAGTGRSPFHYHLQALSKSLFYFLTVCLTPLVKSPPDCDTWCHIVLSTGDPFNLLPALPCPWNWVAVSQGSFSVQPGLQLLFEHPLLCVYCVFFMGQRHITTLAAALDCFGIFLVIPVFLILC